MMQKLTSLNLNIILLSIGFLACQSETDSNQDEPKPLNIVWLVTEDMGFYLPTFGDSTISTPNLSRLAAEGIAYTHLFSPSGVCAPSRAAIATGLYPSSFGANHMRTSSYTEERGMPGYEAIPPPEVKMMSEILRRNGYYCTNNNKEDYQFNAPVTAWDESSIFAHWRNRQPGQPFFSIFNFTDTHESGLFEPYGHRNIEQRHYMAGDTSFRPEEHRGRMTEEETPVHLPRDQEFVVPPYLPNTELVQRDMWKVYNNIAEMDRQVGAVLSQLEADGLMDNTVIFFYADHGGPLPRQKRLIYDSGLRSPMIIRFPDKKAAGTYDHQLLSFIDFAPTVLSLAGIEPPSYLHGQAFLGAYQAAEPRSFIHAAADRFDAFTDAIRAVRGPRYKYIRNYRPEQGYYLPVTYRERIPTMQELLRLRDAGQLTLEQAQWFREQKPAEELFDCVSDPHELHNLAGDPDYAEQLNTLRMEMDRWLNKIGDQPNLPEEELLAQLWNGSSTQPVTADPEITQKEGQVTITCATIGASIGYQKIMEGKAPKSWAIYTGPLTLGENESLRVLAHRIGFKPSEMIETNPAD